LTVFGKYCFNLDTVTKNVCGPYLTSHENVGLRNVVAIHVGILFIYLFDSDLWPISQAVLPASIFLCHIVEIWYFVKVARINVFRLVHL